MTFRVFIILITAILFTSGCAKTDRISLEISQLLDARATALNSKNISLYLSLISSKYNDKGKSFINIKDNIVTNFKKFDKIVYEADTPSISFDGKSVESIRNYRLKVTVYGKDSTLNGIEHLKFNKEADGWKIIAGI